MRALEQRIVEGGEASISSASMVEMQQVLFPGTHRFTFKYFNLFFQICNYYFYYFCTVVDCCKINDSVQRKGF